MNNIDKELDRAYKELKVSDPYSETHEDFMKEFDDPIEVRLSDQTKDSMDKFFVVNEEEVNKNNDIIKTLALCAALFCLICVCVVFMMNKNKSIELSADGMKYEDNWTEFKEETEHKKDRDIIIKIYDNKSIKSELKLKYDGDKYSYGETGKKYKYLLDESGAIDELGLKLRLIVLADKQYTFEELYNSLYYNIDQNVDFKYGNVDIDKLKDSVNILNQTINDISKEIDGDDTSEDNNIIDEIEDIKYQLIYYY